MGRIAAVAAHFKRLEFGILAVPEFVCVCQPQKEHPHLLRRCAPDRSSPSACSVSELLLLLVGAVVAFVGGVCGACVVRELLERWYSR